MLRSELKAASKDTKKEIGIVERINNRWHQKTIILAVAAIAFIGFVAYYNLRQQKIPSGSGPATGTSNTNENKPLVPEETSSRRLVKGYTQNCNTDQDCPTGTKCYQDNCIPLDMQVRSIDSTKSHVEKSQANYEDIGADKSRIGEDSGLYKVIVEKTIH